MKVEVHDLKHQKWFVYVEPSQTIADVKERNYADHGIDRSLAQKLIFSGKILKDSDTLETIKYQEGKGFLVCMASKARQPAKARETASAPPPSAQASSSPSTGASQLATNSSNALTTPLVPSIEPGFPSGPSALATGAQLQEVVTNIMDMGYSQQQVLLAMRRAFNNPDRAVEYLVTGQIPDSVAEEPAPAAPPAANSDSTAPAAAAADPSGPNQTNTSEPSTDRSPLETSAEPATTNTSRMNSIDHNLFDAADQQAMDDEEEAEDEEEEIDFQELLGLDDSQLEELRTAVRQNPSDLLKILDPIVRDNTVVADVLINKLDQFLWYMTSPEERAALGDRIPENGDALPNSEGGHVISLSEDETAAVHRLMELGFEWEAAAMAYLACDKDEEVSANYLFEHGNDMEW